MTEAEILEAVERVESPPPGAPTGSARLSLAKAIRTRSRLVAEVSESPDHYAGLAESWLTDGAANDDPVAYVLADVFSELARTARNEARMSTPDFPFRERRP